jgi:hypothetical protein
VIAFNHVDTGRRIEAPDSVDPFGYFVKGAVDQVAGDQDQLGTEIVHDDGHFAEDRALGESARVHVAHLRDRQAVEGVWQVANGNGHSADSELLQLPESDRGQTDSEQLRRESGGSGEESAATHSSIIDMSVEGFARHSLSDFADHPGKKRDDGTDHQERKEKRQDQQMPKIDCCHKGRGQVVPSSRLPEEEDKQQAAQLKAAEETVQNPDPAFRSRSAQEPIRRQPPDEIQQEEDGDDDQDDRHAEGTLVFGTQNFQQGAISGAAEVIL